MQPWNPRSANRPEDDSCLAILVSWDSIRFYMSFNMASYMHGFRNEDTLDMIRSDIGSRDKAAEPMVLLPADLAQFQLYFGKEQSGQMR